jgi:trehalose 6-phosphate synthase/phosphatase
MATTTNTSRRLIVVSNRLPFSVSTEGGTLSFVETTGGLVTGLSSYLHPVEKCTRPFSEHLWVGWPGTTVPENQQDEVRTMAMQGHASIPVFLSQEEMDQFYLGFCNKTIWPLFHYFPSFTNYDERFWEQYKRVNTMFCKTLAEIVTKDDIVWIHDYHLMLLPALLKSTAPETPTGFFLHIPFPSFELFRLLPGRWRREILEGLLGADLIGFHTYEYVQHFLQSVLRILGHEHHMGQILTPSRVVKAETFPMGIDFEKYATAAHGPEVQSQLQLLKSSLTDVRVILSVDRLDYSKGILNRLQGFELLLELHPEYHGKVVLAMIVVPSRIGVDQYVLMKKQIEELVGSINGKYGRIGWTPILYQYRQMDFASLSALYVISDVCLVTPLRDGMNLVAKEYVASRVEGLGVLIVSEMAGAAKELAEAIVINPNDRFEVAEAMREAIEMRVEEQRRRMQIMRNRLRRYTVGRWADDFVEQLNGMREVQRRFSAKLLTPTMKRKVSEQYGRSSRRLLFLDYDGTLVPLQRYADLAKPTEELIGLLRLLSADVKNNVVIISGRDKGTLEQWFGRLPVSLVAEHGVWLKEIGKDWLTLQHHTIDWKSRLLPVLEQYADRVPGTYVEEKDYSLVWHYRRADPDQSSAVAAELTDHLVSFTASIDVHVLQGNKVVEVRNAGVDKGSAARELLSGDSYEFILAVGDDWTDEDLFKNLPEGSVSIKVGVTNTQAVYNLRNPAEVTKLLESFVQAVKYQGEASVAISPTK